MDSRRAAVFFVLLVAASSTVYADAHQLAQSRVIFLDHGGARITPGDNDSSAGTSSVVLHPVHIPAWQTTPAIWSDTVACVSEAFARFDVTVTDNDPGEVPHIQAVFGGSPTTLGLARSFAGVSPFTDDCAVVERSIVFVFTDILPNDARAACNVAVQEIAHSYGLDHELLETDPMTCHHSAERREFADEDVACGESVARPCGLGGSTCRASQNSYALLASRLGVKDAASALATASAAEPEQLGCAATSPGGWGSLGVVLACLLARRRTAFAPSRPEN